MVEHTQRSWTARCLTCGLKFPLPGIRYRAAGRPVLLRPCPRCERWRCCRVEPVMLEARDPQAWPACRPS